MRSVYAALTTLDQPDEPKAPEAPVVQKPTASQIRKSVSDDGLVSFIDGKRYKALKRHVAGHGFTPATYRERYGLPLDYPMTSPNYSAMRSDMAKKVGLGQKRVGAGMGAMAAKKTVRRPNRAAATTTDA